MSPITKSPFAKFIYPAKSWIWEEVKLPGKPHYCTNHSAITFEGKLRN